MTAANTVTISRLGPSGSFINANIAREATREVAPSIINEIVFDLKYMGLSILELLLFASYRELDDFFELFNIHVSELIDIEAPAALFVCAELQEKVVVFFVFL